ncbi:unnamed protein product [Leptidea sinapis]|uniref:AAA+ ATPase domain-containing protein n=2 Tax=Leptidea sinapis TaxID=189913 RepID=A0A5E4PTI4_9NEOP|nr:unnamed protein product [Leptidea sinapis]
MQRGKKWFKPVFDIDEDNACSKKFKSDKIKPIERSSNIEEKPIKCSGKIFNGNSITWLRNFDPINVEDLAVNNKKIQEVEEWLQISCSSSHNNSNILLLTGPVGCGKTATIHVLASKLNIKVTEWTTPIDIELPSDNGAYEFKESQSKRFLNFLLNAANFTSLLDNNNKKLVMVEDFPNIFLRTSSEFAGVLQQYKERAKSPIIFICSETYTDNKDTALNLFTQTFKEQFNINQIMFNSVSATGLRAALKRASEIISQHFGSTYNTPNSDIIESVINSSGGDVRSAITNLHFALLKGSVNLETSMILKEEVKKSNKRKKNSSSKFMSLGKDQTVSILHGVGRVLNPKVIISKDGSKTLTHLPKDIIEQFLSQPSSFIAFLEENYLPHFSCIHDEKTCQEYGLYTAVSGLMLANLSPVSAWNPVRGPKNMRIQYPSLVDLPQLDNNFLYKGKVLVTDYVTYCRIIGNNVSPQEIED